MAKALSVYERLTSGNRNQRKDLQRGCMRRIRGWMWFMPAPPESILEMKAISWRYLRARCGASTGVWRLDGRSGTNGNPAEIVPNRDGES